MRKLKGKSRNTNDELANLLDHPFKAFKNLSKERLARDIDLDFLCNFNACVNNFR
jgi:hypothetical protein